MKHFLFSISIVLLWIVSCSYEEENAFFDLETGVVSITDTIRFDTLLAGRESFVQRTRLYNRSNQDLTIDNIALRRGEASPYQIIINGSASKAHPSIRVAKNDSLLLLVNLNAKIQEDEWITEVSDRIEWKNPLTDDIQSIVLQSWAVSADEKTNSSICDENWSNNSATLVTDTLLVEANCHLTIDAGARVFFDPNAVLFVAGSLTITGTNENPVILRSSRMDNRYKQAPGLWNGVYFLEGSHDNHLSSAIIENSETGLRLGTPDNDTIADLIIENSIIRHSSRFGIQAYNSDIKSTNLLIYDIGLVPSFHAIGGSYYYEHCTISNFPSQLGSQEPSMVLADHLITESETFQDQLVVDIKNSIFYTGASSSDLVVSTINNTNSVRLFNNLVFSNEEIRQNITNEALDFVHFVDPFSFDYRLDSISPAIDASIGSEVRVDLHGNLRDSIPDLGAIEFLH
ncbi:MAG: hypothetical protein ACO2ZZ_01060 [Cyclobacteriaceae bacterium]